ncbi:MAG: hypothetical protein J5680_06505 [Neisseriaceae bacterium]|nr:hypothetical protein [Neisseriaceae bacterium]
MTDNSNPFTFWQQFWQRTASQSPFFNIPMTLDEIEKRQQELKHIELFLDFNLQAVRSQIALLEQQKQFMNTAENMAKSFYGNNEKDEEKQ